ncbi:LysR family transcriptional regulator [Psychromarinibacter halotolerans]|uniref:LysR family transcriptional regulator n=1 Tax=Psychromarinibacter halotolerans TaxID=1775175 RepID=A0ABV7H069_9RHOB|nr:LysR family transcriptional regulator [Psychromarinibacter halotolerans]MDF0598133.1 LysR family transcriptional regulator [Psychromarinibacter halotolerans]
MAETAGRITLWHIEVFVATAEEASISAAAQRLGASPSSVSQQLTNLEAALGTALLNRNERPMSLTPAGSLFLRRAQAILNEAARAKAELARRDPRMLTRLRIGVIEDFDAEVTPRLLRDLSQEMTGCQFLLETGASHRLIDKLETRALDMIIAAEMGAEAAWMEVHPVLTEPFVAAVPKGAVAEGADLMAVLREMPLILYTERHHMGRVIRSHLAQQNFRLSHRFELDSYHAIMAMVAAGEGWTILTPLGFLHAARFRDQAEVMPLPFAPLSRRISLTARRGVMEDIPARTADTLRGYLQDLIVTPAIERMPWLDGALRVEGD